MAVLRSCPVAVDSVTCSGSQAAKPTSVSKPTCSNQKNRTRRRIRSPPLYPDLHHLQHTPHRCYRAAVLNHLHRMQMHSITFTCLLVLLAAAPSMTFEIAEMTRDLPSYGFAPAPNQTAENHTARRQHAIDQHNALPNTTWRAALSPRFIGLPVGASRRLCGVKPGSAERLREAIRSGRIRNISAASLLGVDGAHASIPDAFDPAEHWPACATVINDIRDQSACGCCWAFAPAEAASDRMCIASNGTLAFPLSAEDTCFCGTTDPANGGCAGGDPATNVIFKKGLTCDVAPTAVERACCRAADERAQLFLPWLAVAGEQEAKFFFRCVKRTAKIRKK